MLPRNQQQEALSRAYVRAVAARAGLTSTDVGQDFGIDMLLRWVEVRTDGYLDAGPQLDLQIRSTTRAEIRDGSIFYDVDVRAYNLLREVIVHGWPRLLVLLVLPEDESHWLTQSIDELILRRCAYWISWRGRSAVTADYTTRIAIPQTNIFSPQAVQNLITQLQQGVLP